MFEAASPAALDAVARRAIEVRFAPDEVLFLAGSAPRGWYIVLEGRVRVVRAEGGRQHVIHTEGPGGTLGEVPLFAGDTHPAMGIASEPTRCALLDQPSLEAAMREAPEVGFLVARRLALRVRTLVDRLNARSARSVRGRLIDFLLDRSGSASTGSFSLGMTQRDVAEELGTVREVIGREIQFLVKAGLLAARGGGRYQVLDDAGLRALAD